jgi:D-glycero-D-manno-heptose 1,7-bisphosphate phosphatase
MPFIILDRDGVINEDSDDYIKSPDEWHAIPGSLQAIARLNQVGYHVIIATNQSGIGRGFYDVAMLQSINQKMVAQLKQYSGVITDIFFCPHLPNDQCDCRKPKPGMLLAIQKKYSLNLSDVFFIGDSVSDIQAAQSAGCQPLLVRTGKGKKTLDDYPDLNLIKHCDDLNQAVDYVLSLDR